VGLGGGEQGGGGGGGGHWGGGGGMGTTYRGHRGVDQGISALWPSVARGICTGLAGVPNLFWKYSWLPVCTGPSSLTSYPAVTGVCCDMTLKSSSSEVLPPSEDSDLAGRADLLDSSPSPSSTSGEEPGLVALRNGGGDPPSSAALRRSTCLSSRAICSE